MRPCAPSEWRRFHAYHYKTPQLSTVASTFILEATFGGDRNCIGLTTGDLSRGGCWSIGGTVYVPSGSWHCSGKMMPGAAMPRSAITVVLPEWQGFGVGGRLSDAAGEWHRRRGSDYYGQTGIRFGSARIFAALGGNRDESHNSAPSLATARLTVRATRR